MTEPPRVTHTTAIASRPRMNGGPGHDVLFRLSGRLRGEQAYQHFHGDFWDDDASWRMRQAPAERNTPDGLILDWVLDDDLPRARGLIDTALADFYARYGPDGPSLPV